MKKGILILLGMFMMVSSVEAKTGENLPNRFRVFNYSYENSVNFFENGIEFFIFTNGDFDFDTSLRNRNVRINRDFNGRIRTIGNVFIRYDRFGNVTRIGDVFMKYNRNRLVRVGDLRVNYNRWGYPVFYGNVRDFYYNSGVRFNVSFGDVFVYNDPYFFRNDFRRNYTQFREDRNFYYYKARPNARIGKRSTIIKRRKSNANVNRRNTINRNRNNSYRKAREVNNNRRNTTVNNRKANIKRNTSKVNTKTKRSTTVNRNKNNVIKNSRNTNTKSINNKRANTRSTKKVVKTRFTRTSKNKGTSNSNAKRRRS